MAPLTPFAKIKTVSKPVGLGGGDVSLVDRGISENRDK